MSDAQGQIERKLAESDVPADDAAAEETMEANPHPDRTQAFTRATFSRMRTGWIGDDKDMIMRLEGLSDQIIRRRFSVAFGVRERLWRHVRTQRHQPGTGELLTYEDGSPQWERDEFGVPVEDWERLSDRDRRALLMIILTHMFEWELARADMWAEAMYAKGEWEEFFSYGYTAVPAHVLSGKATIEDRTHNAQKNAAEARYFALFQSALSRKADGIVRAMSGIQRGLERAWD